MSNLSDFIPTPAGALPVVTATHTIHGTTLTVSKNYQINMSGASANVSCPIPAGGTAGNLKININPASSLYKFTFTGTSGNQFRYSGTIYDSIDIPAALETGIELLWDGTYWCVTDSSVPVSGTFSGALTVTGALTPSGGIVGRIDGSNPSATHIGQIAFTGLTQRSGTGGYSYSVQASADAGVGSYSTVASIDLDKGVYIVFGTHQSSLSTVGTGRLYVQISVEGTAVTSSRWSALVTNTQEASAQCMAPIVITADATTVALQARMYDQTPTGGLAELSVIRVG